MSKGILQIEKIQEINVIPSIEEIHLETAKKTRLNLNPIEAGPNLTEVDDLNEHDDTKILQASINRLKPHIVIIPSKRGSMIRAA
jgi:hypothetical protein